MFLQPYLHFNGRCDEAIKFYGEVLGAKVNMLMRFSDNPDPQSRAMTAPGMEDKVMHSNVTFRDTQIMMSDGRCAGEDAKFDGFTLTLNVTADEADKIFAALGEGGQVQMPLSETFFAYKFGMLDDKFGVSWMILAAKPQV